MAELIAIEEEETPDEFGPLDIDTILASENLADELPLAKLNEIGSRCIRDFDIDETSRKDWLARYKRSLDIAMQVREEKTWPWRKAANIHYPMLTTAAVQFQARAYPAIVDGSNLVKGRVLGPDPQGVKRDRATRVGQHMTYQLLYQMPGWEEDTDRLLLALPIVGCMFRKSYFDPIRATNMSVTVSAEHFVVNYWAKSLDSTPRYTHVMPMYPYEVRERVKAGMWREIPIEQEGEHEQDDQGPVDILEQHCLIDLDEDGYPEPYIVTLTKRGDIAKIVPCFDAEGVTVNGEGEVVRIERRQYFTKYGFIPAPDGSFYDMGFGTLLEDLSGAIDATINQMLDAGTLQNLQGGFIGSGVNIRGGDFRFRAPGEYKRVNVTGGTLRENIVQMQFPGPSAVLFNLLGMLIEAAKGITSVQDIMTGGDVGQNTPATTTLARIEQGLKVMTGIFKRIHRAFGHELKVLFKLNGDHLDDAFYAELNDTPVQVGRMDYQQGDVDVCPVSDPTMATDMQKLARAELLMSQQANPLLDPMEITRRYFEAAGITDVEKLFKQGETPPNPEAMLAVEQQADNRMKAKADVMAKKAAAAESFASTAKTLQELGQFQDAVVLVEAARNIIAEFTEDENAEPTDGQGPVQPMEGPSPDQGVPVLSPEAAGEPDGGMGFGGGTLGAGPDGGIPMQPVPEPEF